MVPIDRNEEIWRKRTKEKKTLKALAEEYGISSERVRQILKSTERRHEYDEKVHGSLKFMLTEEFSELLEGRKPSSISIVRLINAMLRGMPREKRSGIGPREFMEWFMSMDIPDLIEIRNVGPVQLSILLKMQERIRNNDALLERMCGCKTIV